MATAGSITVSLLAATGSFETDMQRASKRVKQFEKDTKVAAIALAAMTGAVAGTAFGVFINNTIQAEKEQAQLAAVLKSTGEAAGYSRKQLNDMAKSMSMMSTVSAGEINSAQTTLLAFTGIVGEQFPQALQAAVDMAARTGMSVVQAAETIGRALDVPSQGLTSLSKQGFRFTDDQKKLAERLEATGKTAEAQGIILSALEESYGGAAKAARDTFGGAVTGLKNSLNDLITGDDGSLEGAKEAVNLLTGVLESAETKEAFSTFVGWMADAARAVATLSNQFIEGIKYSDGFFDALMKYGLTDPSKSPSQHLARIQKELDTLNKDTKELVGSMKDGTLSIMDIDPIALGGDARAEKIRGLLLEQQYWERQRQRAEDEIFQSYRNAGETGGVPMLGSNTIRPPDGGGGNNKPGKPKKQERLFIADDLDQYFTRIGELPEWLDAYEIKAQKTFDKTGEFALEAARNIQSSLGDGLYSILSGNFDDIGRKFSDTLLRMAADATAADLAGALFGDYDKNGKVGGLFGSLISSIWPSANALAGVTASSSFNLSSGMSSFGDLIPSFGAGFSGGGFTGFGGKHQPAGIVHKGEVVFSQDDVRKHGGVARVEAMRLRGYADGGIVGGGTAGVGNTKIEIINQSSQPVQARSDGPRFNGTEYVTSIVLTDFKNNGPIRRAIGGI